MVRKILSLINEQYYSADFNRFNHDENIFIKVNGKKLYEHLKYLDSVEKYDFKLAKGKYLFLQDKREIKVDDNLAKDLDSYAVWKGYKLAGDSVSRFIKEDDGIEFQLLIPLEELNCAVNLIN